MSLHSRRRRRLPIVLAVAMVGAATVVISSSSTGDGGRPAATVRAGAGPAPAHRGGGPSTRLVALPGQALTWAPVHAINPKTLYSGPVVSALTQAGAPAKPGGAPPADAAVPASSVHPGAPAPAGFAGQLSAMYATATKVAASAPSLPSPPPTSDFNQALASLTPAQLSELYDALQKAPGGFQGLVNDFATMNSTASAARTPSAVHTQGVTPGTGITFTGATTETTDAAGNAGNCPAGAPGGNYGEDAIYAATLAVDIATTADAVVPQALALGAYVLGEGTTFTIPDPVNIVVQALIGAAQIARDTLIWQNAINSDCTSVAQEEQIGIIFDNVNSLVTLVDSRTTAIDNEEQLLYALADERNTLILNKIGAIQASLNLELKVTIEEDLLQGTHGAVADLEVPASDGGYLNATPIGVQEVVGAALISEQQAGQSVNPAAPGELAIANADLAGGQYKAAFSEYSVAYRDIVAP